MSYDFFPDLLNSVWRHLTEWSGGLQSIQIIILGLVAFVSALLAILKFFLKHLPKSKKVSGNHIKKRIIAVERGRLTAIVGFNGKLLSGGFSGVAHRLNYKRVVDRSAAQFGLIRSLYIHDARGVVLIGNDEGTLFAHFLKTGKSIAIGSFASPIYKVSRYSEKQICLGLGSGDFVVCELKASPGQDGLFLTVVSRDRRHNGSIFDIAITPGIAVATTGADGTISISYLKGRRKAYKYQPEGPPQTLWSAVEISEDKYLFAANDGSLTLIQRSEQLDKRQVHKASIRNIALSPQRKWCITVGKDRAVCATATDLSGSILLHLTKDYGYQVVFTHGGQKIVVCDGAGEVTIIDLPEPIDNLSLGALEGLAL